MEDENAFDLNNGNVPSWTLKIEGRLLDVRSIARTNSRILMTSISSLLLLQNQHNLPKSSLHSFAL